MGIHAVFNIQLEPEARPPAGDYNGFVTGLFKVNAADKPSRRQKVGASNIPDDLAHFPADDIYESGYLVLNPEQLDFLQRINDPDQYQRLINYGYLVQGNNPENWRWSCFVFDQQTVLIGEVRTLAGSVQVGRIIGIGGQRRDLADCIGYDPDVVLSRPHLVHKLDLFNYPMFISSDYPLTFDGAGQIGYIRMEELVPVTPPEPPPLWNLFTVPSDGTWRQLLHDYERAEYEYKPRGLKEIPETVPFNVQDSAEFTPLDRDHQQFWFELMWEANGRTKTHAEMLAIWEDVTADTKMLTDQHAVQNGFTDFILGRNIGSAKGPIQIKCLGSGGNIVRAVSGRTIATLHPDTPLPLPAKFLKNRALCQWTTTTGQRDADGNSNKLPDGTWRVSGFPNQKPYGVPYPLMCATSASLRDDTFKPIAGGTVYSPYNPVDMPPPPSGGPVSILDGRGVYERFA